MTDDSGQADVTAPAATVGTPAPPPPKRARFDRSIVEGPLRSAVWKLAWPTMVVNIIGGMQGMVDQVMVGHIVGYTGNAAIGVASQLMLVVIIFITSIFTGMSVLVARFAGAGDEDKVNRTIYQAFLTAAAMAVLIMAPVGYFLAPSLLDFVNAAPAVQAEALPYLRIMFVFSFGMLVFFMLGGALRSAGDARTPMVLGIVMTGLNIVFNIILIAGLGPVPAFRTAGAAMGTVLASGLVAIYAMIKLWRGGWVVAFPRGQGWGPDWKLIRELFRFGLPTGVQGIAMNVGGVLMLSFIGSLAESAAAQAAFSVSYSQLFSFITWTSVGLMGAAAATAGQNLGAQEPERASKAVRIAAEMGLAVAAFVGIFFLFFPRQLLAIFGMNEPVVVEIGVQLLHVLSLSGLFITVALTYTGGLQGTGDTRSPLWISIVSQVVIPLGICFVIQETIGLQPLHIWLAILAGHMTRCLLSVWRFGQGKWRGIEVRV
ncbi:MAG TPA: MATE family efflux transporter [Gemmatimonadales bacterium]|nr:MATE family efflux transporter [Gemmatimonadales bacterium]HET7603425.1 MATE family efflux transporter [Gemmatimonadales bacterium]